MKYLEVTRKNNYAIVQMNRPKVNAINAELVADLRKCFKDLGADETVQGVILTGLPKYFSAGLDLVELYDYDEAKIRQFLTDFITMHVEMVKFEKPFICAITGHSPAGGTVIAIAADYRVMAEGEKYTIGLNEVAVNVQISENLIRAYSFWLGRQEAYKNILAGNLLKANEALAKGLVDEVVPLDDVLSRAERRMRHYLQADPNILKNTKAKLRKDWRENLVYDEAELEQALEVWWSKDVRMKMQLFIAMLKSRNA